MKKAPVSPGATLAGIVGSLLVGSLIALGLAPALAVAPIRRKSAGLPSLEGFVKSALPFARRIEQLHGIPSAFGLAQAALESANGGRAPGNNYFGIKAGKSWQGSTTALLTHEVDSAGQVHQVTASFRAYPTVEAGWDDWASVVKRVAKIQSGDPLAWVSAVARGGYATAPNYQAVLTSKLNQVLAIVRQTTNS